MAQGPKRGSFSRSRNLSDFNLKLVNDTLEDCIRTSLMMGEQGKILEIGCGEGRVTLELAKLFPDIEIHGINKRPWRAMKGQQSLRAAARYYKIFREGELRRATLPTVHFCSAESLPFEDNQFNLVYSQVSIYQIPKKDRVIEEVWRVLKPLGSAYIEIDSSRPSDPDFMHVKTPRFVIYSGGKAYPFRRFISDVSRRTGYHISAYEVSEERDGETITRTMLAMHKEKEGSLDLGLSFDEGSSFDLGQLKKKGPDGNDICGYRSVYHI